MVKAAFGAQLGRLRGKHSVNLRELSEASGIDFSLISKYENGERNLSKETFLELRDGIDKVLDHRQEERRANDLARNLLRVMKRATAKYPEAAETIKSTANEILAKAPEFIKIFVNESEVRDHLLNTLADATLLNNLLGTAKVDPGKAYRVLRAMEADIQEALSGDKDE